MGDDKKSSLPRRSASGWVLWAFIWGAVGYLIYGDLHGAVAMALFSAVTGLILWLGCIPIVGVWLTFMATNYVKHWLLQYVVMSWAISWIFGLALIGSTLLTIIIILLIIAEAGK